MKHILFVLLALAACSRAPDATPPDASNTLSIADGAGNRMEALANPDAEHTARWCTGDGVWCVSASDEVAPAVTNTQTETTTELPLVEEGSAGVWPMIVRSRGAGGGEDVIVGITATKQEGYSGGGASQSLLQLYSISSESGLATTALEHPLPLAGAADIRACFSEQDTANRRDACSDQYNFEGALTLDTAPTSGSPVLIFTTEASTYPGRVSRSEDSTAAPPLTQADLVHVRDERCSYRRTLSRNADGAYIPDVPLPECPDYFTQ
ncbi:MAG: hypothetical protein WDM79_14230 [Terricaulis sp.]